MNNFVNTEKSLKRWLKTKVKVTMATVVGFLIAGTVVMGAGTVPTDGVYNNDVLLNTLKSTKFAVGQNGNLEIYSNGSVGLLLSDLQKDHSLSGIMSALSQQNSDPSKVVLTGAVAGEGKYSEGIDKILAAMKEGVDTSLPAEIEKYYPKIKEVINRTNTLGATTDIEGNTTTTIGKTDGKESPVVLGLVGGDFAVGTGKITEANFDKAFVLPSIKLKSDVEETKINRTGSSTVTINNGNVFGGSVGSTAISTGINLKYLSANISLQGNTTTAINGDTKLNINKVSNAAGVTAGGIAAAIGGTSTSTVNGDSIINVNSKVSSEQLEGITVGLFGGGMAVSTLGGSASANTIGTTNVEINNGFSVGVAGGGLAISTDISQLENEIDNNLIKIALQNIKEAKEGGTSKVTSGDINVKLNGTTSAAVVVGNGLAVSHQNSPQGTKPTETDKISTSTVEANDITVNVNLTKKIDGDYIGENGVMTKVADLVEQLKNVVTPNQGTDVNKLITSMKNTVGVLKDGGIAVGVAGNGMAVAADKGVSTVTAANTTTNLNGGYIVGVLGNGIAANNNWAKSTAEVTGKSVVNIDGKDTEVIGVSGNGLAVYYGIGNYNGNLNFDGKALAQVKDSEINIKNGSADGVFGGGVAIDDSQLNTSNAEAITSGTSTINVTGGYVTDFGYKHLGAKKEITGNQDYKSYLNEVYALGDGVAIVAGGVAAGNMAETHVENSVVNISGGKIEGDIIAGGIATRGAKSTVTNSTVNITGGEIIGSIYGTGKAAEAGTKSVVIEAGEATVENSVLNIDGYKNSLIKIADFDEINIGMNKSKTAESDNYDTQLTITDSIDVGAGKLQNAGAIIFGNEKEKSTLMTVAKGGSVLNKGLIVVDAGDKVAKVEDGGDVKNTGKIQVNGVTSDDEKEFDVKQLFDGKFTNIGMIVGTDGKAILTEGEDVVAGDVTIGEITADATKDKVTLEHVNITDGGTISSQAVNVIGNVTNTADFEIANGALNIDSVGNINITDNTELKLSNEKVNGSGTTDIKFAGENSKLVLSNTNVAENVIIGENTTNGIVDFIGADNRFNGTINAKNINIAKGNVVAFGEDAVGAGTISLNGDAAIEVGAENTDGVYSQNFFHNSDGNLNVEGTGNIIIGTKNFEGEKVTVDLGENNTFGTDLVSKLNTTNVYMIEEGEDLTDGKLNLVYNTKLFEDTPELNEINSAAKVVNGVFNEDPELRRVELDKIYSSNIYSETVRAAYDNVKLNEEAVESLARKSQVGKWTAEGKALYSKNEYDRKGIVGDYSSEIESTGLMAAFGYGINETTTAGIALSGVKQDVDTDGGSADADLFYLGVYGNKVVGNYDFTAGLGYQFGEYDADNTIANVHGSDKYDTQALSGYVQGRYTADLGDGLSIQPKVKLGYTYVDQNNAKDSYFGVSDAEISTFDAEAGFDVVKSVQLEKTKVDVKFGASYIKAMGDTDKEFEGRFYGKGTSDKFDVLGAELAENTVKFNLGAEVVNENGFFYNGGFTYEFGSDDTEAYGVNVGVGYKF